jgi:hypothetical protein
MIGARCMHEKLKSVLLTASRFPAGAQFGAMHDRVVLEAGRQVFTDVEQKTGMTGHVRGT